MRVQLTNTPILHRDKRSTHDILYCTQQQKQKTTLAVLRMRAGSVQNNPTGCRALVEEWRRTVGSGHFGEKSKVICNFERILYVCKFETKFVT